MLRLSSSEFDPSRTWVVLFCRLTFLQIALAPRTKPNGTRPGVGSTFWRSLALDLLYRMHLRLACALRTQRHAPNFLPQTAAPRGKNGPWMRFRFVRNPTTASVPRFFDRPGIASQDWHNHVV
jgi:hypothetical protein